MYSVLVHDAIKIKYVTEGYISKNYPPHLLSDIEMMEGFLCDHLDEIINDEDIKARYWTSKWLLTENEESVMTENDEGIIEDEIDIVPDPAFMRDRFTGYYMDYYVKPMFRQFSSLDLSEMTNDEIVVFNIMYNLAVYISELFAEYEDGVCAGTIESKIEKIFPDWVYSYMFGVVIGHKSDVLDKHDLLVLLDLDNLDDNFTIEAAMECSRISKKWLNKYGSDDRPITCFGEPHVIKSLRLDNII